MADRFIGRFPPSDGRDWEPQCARCGSSIGSERCDGCGGEGLSGHDCGEDSCCCVHPHDNVRCQHCGGRGYFTLCLASPEWCTNFPMLHRPRTPRGSIEWCTYDVQTASEATDA